MADIQLHQEPAGGVAAREEGRDRVPPRAALISVAALAVPLYASLFASDTAGDYEILLWLLALVPAFLLAYYRGWRGAAVALALGMGLLAMTQVVLVVRGDRIENWQLLLAVVVAYIFISLGAGLSAELLHRERDRAEQLALSDELTGLANRRQARLVLEKEFAAAHRGRLLTIVIFDLDHFKSYNDRFGHAAGDEALRTFGSVLGRTTRQMNLSARLGGEEFVSILSENDLAGTLIFVERVRTALRAAEVPNGGLTFSAGVAQYAPGMRTADELLAAADAALYRAKAAGRDRTEIHPSGESLAGSVAGSTRETR